MYNITLFEGDGIGPEITESVKKVLKAVKLDINYHSFLLGERAYKEYGTLIPEEAIASLKETKVGLKAPVTTPIGEGFRSVNVSLRLMFDLYTNVRPAISFPNTLAQFKDIDLVVIRENTEDLYIGKEILVEGGAEATKLITENASRRIIRYAFEYALANNRKRVTCAHKANILKKTDGLFLKIFNEIKLEYPNISSDDKIIDNMCMQLTMYPQRYDVIVAPNLYGDILSDLCAGLTGGLGLIPGANIGAEMAIFEPVHGSAPDIAGKNVANPIALLLSACMMLDHLGETKKATQIRKAIEKTLQDNIVKTKDLGGTATTEEITSEIISNL